MEFAPGSRGGTVYRLRLRAFSGEGRTAASTRKPECFAELLCAAEAEAQLSGEFSRRRNLQALSPVGGDEREQLPLVFVSAVGTKSVG